MAFNKQLSSSLKLVCITVIFMGIMVVNMNVTIINAIPLLFLWFYP